MPRVTTPDHHTQDPHQHEHLPLPVPSHKGSVVLDIGAGNGALVIHANAVDDGLEIHISPAGRDEQRTHAAVRPRHLPDRTLFAAVITPLPAGSYTVWHQHGARHGTTVINDGQVSDYQWT
ncbi:hypothetical protein [Streptacidiphilus jiangxiensis]|uniref:Phospholipase n=1 Tax=Streptacidiphilus jiangxiensis TaxID=235985 RepID=A0A1H7NT63_STRJI|nr:hypothetical protein [Streptacidiphilus jiangxiensis]SEL26195.1 hypothetical protein SAMN05414137_10746 [Streptacidiphilus jiangxiensis]